MPSLTVKCLIDAGYLPFWDPVTNQSLQPYYRQSFLKFVTNSHGKKYDLIIRHGQLPHRQFFAPNAQFTRDHVLFDVELSDHDGITLDEIETFYADTWIKLKADYYHHEKHHRSLAKHKNDIDAMLNPDRGLVGL